MDNLILDQVEELEKLMTTREIKTADIYKRQVEAVLKHMRYTAELCPVDHHGESWWVGNMPAFPLAASREMVLAESECPERLEHDSNWAERLDRALEQYVQDLYTHNMDTRINSLRGVLGEYGSDVFKNSPDILD